MNAADEDYLLSRIKAERGNNNDVIAQLLNKGGSKGSDVDNEYFEELLNDLQDFNE